MSWAPVEVAAQRGRYLIWFSFCINTAHIQLFFLAHSECLSCDLSVLLVVKRGLQALAPLSQREALMSTTTLPWTKWLNHSLKISAEGDPPLDQLVPFGKFRWLYFSGRLGLLHKCFNGIASVCKTCISCCWSSAAQRPRPNPKPWCNQERASEAAVRFYTSSHQ